MRFLSLCSGIEAASVTWLPLGWTCIAVAEIEPFPRSALAHHYPGVLNLGDVTKITRAQIRALGHIDVVIYGFPCQDLSVAGKRKGLNHADGTITRSGIFFHCAEISRWAKARRQVVENVPGLISNNSGRDFAAVVGELAGCEINVPGDGRRNSGVVLGKRGLVEWAILDCQYRGLAQRRNRVFLVVDTGDWSYRPPILFDAQSLRRNPPPRRGTGQFLAPSLAARTRGGGGLGTDAECDGAMIPAVCPTIGASGAGFARSGNERTESKSLIAFPESYSNQSISISDCAPCLEAQNITAIAFDRAQITSKANRSRVESGLPAGTLSSDSKLMVAIGIDGADVGFALRADGSHSGDKGDGGMNTTVVAHALRGDGFDASEDGTGRGMPLVPNVAGALNHESHGGITGQSANNGMLIPDVASSLEATSGQRSNPSHQTYLPQKWGVRRLTPRECERLQGFPDDYTLIPHRGKPAADSPRYRALGNSMPVPVIRYIGERIEWVSK